MSTYLLEIGTEELPAKFADSIIKQFKSLVEFEFDKNFIKYEEIFCSTTPRRIVLFVTGLIDKGEDKIEFKKGPKVEVAFLNGLPTKAAKGFAKSLNLDVNNLKVENTEKGDFVFAEIIEKGKPTKNLITLIIPKIIKDLQGERFMKWGYGNFKFSRPIRWIISLYNSDVINFSLENINSSLPVGKISRGHRLIKKNIEINHPDKYFISLEEAGVLVKREIRKKRIFSLIENTSKNLKLFPDLPQNLLNELTDLVEYPDLIIAGFDKQFLNLPLEVLCTVMKNHQRYIPLLKTDKNFSKLELNSYNILSTTFLCISNGLKQSNSLIQKGNENVLKARFSDAKFFIESDKNVSCLDRNIRIKEISYLKGLGNIYQRVDRIEHISQLIFRVLEDKTLNFQEIVDSARFSKHDLCSEIVFEFPELQGLMGGKYLKNEGFSDNVSLAVSEHYLPRFYNDKLPSTKYGAITSLSDKFETIISIFVIGKRPTGSSDPYALRRNSNGLIRIIWNYDFELNIDQLVISLLNYWKDNLKELTFDYEKVLFELNEFIRTRIISHLEDLSYEKEIINSICNSDYIERKRIFNIVDLKKRIAIISELKANKYSEKIINVISRFSKLANSGDLQTNIFSSKNNINTDLFEKDSETNIFGFIKQVEGLITSNKWDYSELIILFERNLLILEDLFDNKKGVLIMSDDLDIRKNRLNLLGLIRNYSLLIADFTLLRS